MKMFTNRSRFKLMLKHRGVRDIAEFRSGLQLGRFKSFEIPF